MTRLVSFLALLLLGAPALAQRDAKIPDPDPEIERKTFTVPDGFEVTLYAADPLLAKPIQMNFDSKGRLWIASSEVYPQIKPGQKANDKILILEDTKGVGKADKTTIFAEGLLIPTAVEPDNLGGCYAADSTDLVYFSDPDPKTGIARKKKIVLTGFGTEDTHHILHTFRTGPDCLLYMSQSIYIHSHIETPHGVRRLNAGGIWQFRPESEKLDIFARGWVNSWGIAWTKFGSTFATDGAGGEGINYVVPGAAYATARDVARILPGLNPGSPKDCGLEIISGSHLPADWQQNAITNDFRGHRVCRYILQEDGAGFSSKEQKELIKSNHPAFRPIDVKMGPDGAIYIADWYNPIIQHGEVDFRDPRRDKTHGRIWRVTAKGRPLVEKPVIAGAPIPDLFKLLSSPEDWTRSHAKRELQARGEKDVAPALAKYLEQQLGAPQLLEALWLSQALDKPDAKLLKQLLIASDHNIRAAACRVAGDWASRIPDSLAILAPLATDDHPRVRLEAVRALSRVPSSAAAIASALDKPVDRWLDYAIWQSLRETKDQWLPNVLAGTFDFGGDPNKLVFAIRASGVNDISKPLYALLDSGKLSVKQQESCLITLATLAGPADIVPLFERTKENKQLRASLFPILEKSIRERKLPYPKGEWERFKLLINNDSGASRQALSRMLGLWKAEDARKPLEQLATAGELATPASKEDRIAAIEGITLLGGAAAVSFLELSAKANFDLNRQALLGLISLDGAKGAEIAVETVFSKNVSAIEPIFAAFVNRKGGTTILAKAIDGKTIPADVAKIGIRAAKANGQADEALVAALTKAGKLTETKREFTKPELEVLFAEIKEKGDPGRGEAIYRKAELNCLKCHAVAGAGGQVGPDMTSIGASAQVDYLVESLLQPNSKVKEGYNSVVVTTDDDRVFAGIKIRDTAEVLVLRDAEDKEIAISKKDKPLVKPGRSLMPDGLTDQLTRQEFVDLVRFLSELGKGTYLAQPGKVVRRWESVSPSAALSEAINRTSLTAVATEPGLSWAPVYSTVAGELPTESITTFRTGKDGPPKAAVRFQLDCTTGGTAKLKWNDVAGLQLWIDGRPLEPAKEMTIDLTAGVRTIVAAMNIEDRKVPLRVELEEVPNSLARVRIVTGK